MSWLAVSCLPRSCHKTIPEGGILLKLASSISQVSSSGSDAAKYFLEELSKVFVLCFPRVVYLTSRWGRMRGLPPVLRVLLRKTEKPVYKVHQRSVTHVCATMYCLCCTSSPFEAMMFTVSLPLPGRFLTAQQTCVSKCPAGFFASWPSAACEACPPGCLQCADAEHCIRCLSTRKAQLFLQDGQCVAECDRWGVVYGDVTISECHSAMLPQWQVHRTIFIVIF